MPPTAADQAETVVDVVYALGGWQRAHRDFVVRSNEAGMMLGGEIRAADIAVWRRADLTPSDRGLARVAPVLAIEVAGRAEAIDYLDGKTQWYLDHGVELIWRVYPEQREVHVVTQDDTCILPPGDQIPAHPALPDLTPDVDQLFVQLAECGVL